MILIKKEGCFKIKFETAFIIYRSYRFLTSFPVLATKPFLKV